MQVGRVTIVGGEKELISDFTNSQLTAAGGANCPSSAASRLLSLVKYKVHLLRIVRGPDLIGLKINK